MRITLTNDELIGLYINDKIIWCSTQAEALNIMWSVFGPRQQFSKQEIAADLAYGIDHCAKTHDNIIEFGVLGSFMYTTKEEDSGF